MLLLGAILLAIFVLPSPWGIVAVVAGGLTDVAESLVASHQLLSGGRAPIPVDEASFGLPENEG